MEAIGQNKVGETMWGERGPKPDDISIYFKYILAFLVKKEKGRACTGMHFKVLKGHAQPFQETTFFPPLLKTLMTTYRYCIALPSA